MRAMPGMSGPGFALGLLALAAGCAGYQLTEPERAFPAMGSEFPRTVARVCVVRTSFLARFMIFPVRDDGVLVGATRGSTHFCYLAEPGHHEIAIEADEAEHAELDAVAGRSYYLKQEVDNVFGHVTCRAKWIEPTEARALLDASTYEVLAGVPGSEAVPRDPPVAPAQKAAAPPPGAPSSCLRLLSDPADFQRRTILEEHSAWTRRIKHRAPSPSSRSRTI
jgi:hypothetical protein